VASVLQSSRGGKRLILWKWTRSPRTHFAHTTRVPGVFEEAIASERSAESAGHFYGDNIIARMLVRAIPQHCIKS
jgi:hypothetical protein